MKIYKKQNQNKTKKTAKTSTKKELVNLEERIKKEKLAKNKCKA